MSKKRHIYNFRINLFNLFIHVWLSRLTSQLFQKKTFSFGGVDGCVLFVNSVVQYYSVHFSFSSQVSWRIIKKRKYPILIRVKSIKLDKISK